MQSWPDSTTTRMPAERSAALAGVLRCAPSRSTGVSRPRTLTISPRPCTVVTMLGRGRNDSRTERVGIDVALVAHADEQAFDDRQRERQRDRERGAPADGRVDLDLAPHPLDVAADDVHPDAAARQVGDLLRRGEARREDEVEERPGRRGCRAGFTRPRSTALARIRSAFRPRPSSWISMTMKPPRWKARSVIVPDGGLPAATRSACGSIP